MSTDDASSWVGQTIGDGRWEIVEELDVGCFGWTLLANDAEFGAAVLLRVPVPRLAGDKSWRTLFATEVERLYVEQPDRFLPVVDTGKHGQTPLAVVQRQAEQTLAAEFRNDTRSCESRLDDLCQWLPEIGQALDALHERGLLHRDVRLGTLWRAADGSVWLGDVSLTHVAYRREQQFGRGLTDNGLVLGTPESMAPELIIGVNYGAAVDQYALATCIYEILAGRPPHVGATPTAVLLAHTREPVPPLEAFCPEVSREVAEVLERALDKEQSLRFPNCEAFGRAFVSAVTGVEIDDPAEEELQRPRASVTEAAAARSGRLSEQQQGDSLEDVNTVELPRKKGGRKLVIGGVVLLLLGVAGYFGWSQLKPATPPEPPPITQTRKPRSREGVAKFNQLLKQPLSMDIPADSLKQSLAVIAKQLKVKLRVDEEALKSAQINLQDAFPIHSKDRTAQQALHQLINSHDALRLMTNEAGDELVLTTDSPTDVGGLTGIPLGSLAAGMPIEESLQLPVDLPLAGKPLPEALEAIRSATRMPVVLDEAALTEAQIQPGPVPDSYKQDVGTAQEALASMMKEYGNLKAVANPAKGQVLITTPEKAKELGLQDVAEIERPKPIPPTTIVKVPANAVVGNAAGEAATATTPTTAMAEAMPIASPELAPPPGTIIPERSGTIRTSLGIMMMLCERGEFFMGALDTATASLPDEQPEHLVKLRADFWISQTEVTLREFETLLARRPTGIPEDNDIPPENRPVTHVRWFDAIEFCNALSTREQLTPYYDLSDMERDEAGSITSATVTVLDPRGPGYRLPTEAEWEYAYRTGERYPEKLTNLAESFEPRGWFAQNSLGHVHPVGRCLPNEWALFDVAGNVREWCYDVYASDYYESTTLFDPVGPSYGSRRAVRGGSAMDPPEALRSSARGCLPPATADEWTGFRIARTRPATE